MLTALPVTPPWIPSRVFQHYGAPHKVEPHVEEPHVYTDEEEYRKVSNIRRTKSQNLNASRLIL